MFSLVLCLVFVMFEAEASHPNTENSEIRLNYSGNNNEDYIVWKDKPLKIIIENCYARYIWCVNSYVKSIGSSPFVPETSFATNIVCIMNITKVTVEMNTRWSCTVLQEYHGPATPYKHMNRNYTAKDLRFHLHVKGARQVILTANNHNLTYDVATNLLVKYYGNTNYTYEHGEDVEFSCEKSRDETEAEDTLRLEYFNAEGIPLFQTKSRTKPHKFRSVLTSTNDKYYLECICASTNPNREYRYRTTFYEKKDAVKHELMLSVNGQRLTSFSNNDESYEDYIFRYLNGEVLNVTCQKMNYYPQGTLYFNVDPNLTQCIGQKHLNTESGVISLKVHASDMKNKTIICSINNTGVRKPNARLSFSSDVPNYDVRVRGLPRSNVLYQYTNDLYEWTIEYQYSVKDTINITCLSNRGLQDPSLRYYLRNSPLFQWEFEGEPINSSAHETIKAITYSEKSFMKTLVATHNGTKIKCIYFPRGNEEFHYTVEIILRLKPELASEAKMDEATADKKDSSVRMIVPISVTFGVTVALVTMVCLVCWRKRTKRENRNENAYDELSSHHDSPIPAFPRQWDANYDDSHYAKIDEDVMQENYTYSTDDDSLYRKPFKRESNISEDHYTEIDDYFKTKPDELTPNTSSAQSSKYNKYTNAHIGTASHNSNNAIYNNVIDSKQGTYDKLVHKSLPINKSNENYSNVQSKGKNKSVTFRQMSNDLSPGRNYIDENSRQRTDQDIYSKSGDMRNKSNYENNLHQNKKTVNPFDFDYAEPYDDFGMSCKNELYG